MVDGSLDKKVFLICSVRNTSKQDIDKFREYKKEKRKEGYFVHYPNDDTPQDDPIGQNICIINKEAIKESIEVHLYWNPTSVGTRFDLSMVVMANKKLMIINEDELKKPFDEYTKFLLKYSNSSLVKQSKIYDWMMEEKDMIMRQEETSSLLKSFLIDTERLNNKEYFNGEYMNAIYLFGMMFMADKPINLVNSSKLRDYELKKDIELFEAKKEGQKVVTKTFNKVLLCTHYVSNGGKVEDFYDNYLAERNRLYNESKA